MPAMLLEIQNLSTGFNSQTGLKPVLDRVSFAISPGETVALVGESGSGKSVTALSILQLYEKSAVSSSGVILFEGRNLLACNEHEMRTVRGNRIAMIFQEPMTSLNPVYSIGDQIIEPLIIHQNLNRNEARNKAVELLARTGISNPEQRLACFAHQLSGGQRQRAMIAMALACRPALLIADEPTTALDVTIEAQILALIKDLQQEFNMAVLLITHDLNLVKKYADQVNIMHQGRIVEQGLTDKVFNAPVDSYTIHLLESVPKGEPAIKPAGTPLIEIKNLNCHFAVKSGFFKKRVGTIKAVDSAVLTINHGTTCGVVGESGSGKSTLAMCILRLVNCRGEIIYKGTDILKMKNRLLRPLRRELQVVFQDPFSSLSPRFSVEQIIAEGLTVHGIGGKRSARRQLVEETLCEVGLEPEMADRFPHEFSGGQRQRIAIARAIILRPAFLILDEPTSALDMTIQAQIIKLLKDLQAKLGMTYMFISHDLRVIKAMADDLVVMQNGRIVESGPARQVFNAPSHPYTKTLLAAAFDLEAR
ncbi:MAG: microcin ABC transporter ATP-binding protein [Deltaproteobacteria bacterium RIFOXYD12_FULL_50_9]|nr:MAG: microcin ABC transporter ATP-binding protein [Deltaproteobacteria bacterium RIFOXYD12_FULL_50_9]